MTEIRIIEILSKIKDKLNNRLTHSWVNIKQVCNYTSLSESTIRRAIQKGALKVSTTTGKLLFKTSDIDRWLNGKTI